MNETVKLLITVALASAAALLASALMLKFTLTIRGRRLSGGRFSSSPFSRRCFLLRKPRGEVARRGSLVIVTKDKAMKKVAIHYCAV